MPACRLAGADGVSGKGRPAAGGAPAARPAGRLAGRGLAAAGPGRAPAGLAGRPSLKLRIWLPSEGPRDQGCHGPERLPARISPCWAWLMVNILLLSRNPWLGIA